MTGCGDPDGVAGAEFGISEACCGVSADIARHVSQESVQLHGGMRMSEELKISHTFRRLTVIAGQYGDADHPLARFASL